MKAIILAGGIGTRFKPITDSIPKALLPIGNTTLLEIVLNQLPDTIDTVIIVTKYLSVRIEEKIGTIHQNKTVIYARQPEQSEGTWPALYAARQYIENEQFLVLNCDDVFTKEELAAVVASKKIGMGVTQTIMPAKYHTVIIDENNYVEGLQRHPNENREEPVEDIFANGLFLLDEKVFSFEPVALIDGEFGLPQTVLKQLPHYPLFAHRLHHWQPCNTFVDLEKIT